MYTVYWCIIWKVNIRNRGMNLRNTLFCTKMPLWVGISWNAYSLRQVNRQRLEETMYVALSWLLCLWDLEEQRGRGYKFIIRREEETPQQEELSWNPIKELHMELTTELLYLELPTYFSLLWCNKIYELHKIPSY